MDNSLLAKVGTRLGNVDDLPENLRKQIPEFIIEGIDEQVYTVIKEDLEGIGSLSEIMIALFRRFKITDRSRTEITEVVYRLIRKKILTNIKGRKAIYALTTLNMPKSEEVFIEECDASFKDSIKELTKQD